MHVIGAKLKAMEKSSMYPNFYFVILDLQMQNCWNLDNMVRFDKL